MSYSQYQEEHHILEALGGGKPIGRFLDIGAYDGKTFSNTRALAELGWQGVLIEPSPVPLAALKALYADNPRFSVIGQPFGIEAKTVRMWVSEDAVSTTEQANYELWRRHAQFTGEIEVEQYTLDQLFRDHGTAYDFISIDTEGTSVELFAWLPIPQMGTRCVCVEYDNQLERCKAIAKSYGMRVVHENGTNLVLAK